jgi:uncharacterized protein with HEPN domain
MKDNILAFLHDIREAGLSIKSFIAGKTFEDYSNQEMLRCAVERKFEIMGEAMNRIHKENPDYLEKLRDYRDVISFRNILIHGYDSIDVRIVWGIIQEDLDRLLDDVTELLK